MSLAQDWPSYRSTLASAKSKAASAVEAVDLAVTGFERAAFEKRTSAGHCMHDGWFHIGQGFNPGAHAFAPSHYRTRDFIVAEKAIEPTGMVPVIFSELASFDGRLYRSAGYDKQPAILYDDLTTNVIWSSKDGAKPWTQEIDPPPLSREVAALLVHDGYLYQFCGESYTGGTNPTYNMRTDVYRRSATSGWSQRNSNLIKRRSFAYLSWNGSIFIIGGADDNYNGNDYRKVYGDILRSDDGLLSLTNVGDGPFGLGYGRRAAVFRDHVVLVGGIKGDGAFASATEYTGKVWASNDAGLDPESWFELDTLPVQLGHAVVGSLVIDDVETLACIGGYNYNTHENGGPLGTIYTLDSLTGEWQARTDSDFWCE